jgi:hypothetical protein
MTTVTEVNARILELVEKGYESSQIIEILRDDQEKVNEPVESETFPDSIRIISQAFATRRATPDDAHEIYELLKQAYECEINGDEAFLDKSSASLTKEEVLNFITDGSFYFMVMEVPNGLDIEKDGMIIAVCCFSTDGESKRNGVVEGKLCSIRWMAVKLKYQVVI